MCRTNIALFCFQIEQRLLERDKTVTKLQLKVKSLTEEIERRKFIESKVQTYVRSLIDQNEKCKAFIRDLVASDSDDDVQEKARNLLHAIETSQFDEHDGQSTENDENDEEDDDHDDIEVESADQDVDISDIN